MAILNPRDKAGVPTVTPQELFLHFKNIQLIDVRRLEEFTGELGHIEGAQLVTLGPDLTRFLKTGNRDHEIVFVCRSGARSATATLESKALGYKHTANMEGGMIEWGKLGHPIER